MSFRRHLNQQPELLIDHLHEHRDRYVELGIMKPAGSGVPIDEDIGGAPPLATGASSRRRTRSASRAHVRYRHILPVFGRSAWSDPLPYEEPWERAHR